MLLAVEVQLVQNVWLGDQVTTQDNVFFDQNLGLFAREFLEHCNGINTSALNAVVQVVVAREIPAEHFEADAVSVIARGGGELGVGNQPKLSNAADVIQADFTGLEVE